MSKNGFCFFFLMCFFLSCGGKDDLNDYIKKGESFLKIGNPDSARENFLKAKAIDPEDCRANYGLLLSDLLGLSSLLSMGSSMMGGISPQGGVDALATQFFSTIESLFKRIQDSVKVIEKKDCRYSFNSLPIFVGENMFLVMGEWKEGEAQLIGGIADLLNGLIHILLSQNYEFEIDKFLDVFREKYQTYEQLFEDPLELIRFIGYIPSTSKDFLKLSEARKDLFNLGRNELSSGFERLKRALELIFSPDEKDKCPYDDIIMWNDEDNSGDLSSGDQIDIRVYRYDPAEWKKGSDENWKYVPEPYENWKCDGNVYRGCFPLMESLCLEEDIVQLVITDVINENYLRIVKNFLDDISKSIKGEYTEPITMGRFNELIPKEINTLLRLLGIEFKNTMSFRFYKFFEKPRSLREFLPYWFDQDNDGYAEFLIEAESKKLKSEYVKDKDSKHFPEKINFEKEIVEIGIPEDCISPEEDDPIPLIYIAFQDPSLGGLLEINLLPLESCKNDPIYSGWIEPSKISRKDGIYILNRVLNDIIKMLNGIIKTIGITGG